MERCQLCVFLSERGSGGTCGTPTSPKPRSILFVQDSYTRVIEQSLHGT